MNLGTPLLSLENLRKMTYPCDGEGSLCGYDYPEQPYLYYASPTDPVQKILYRSNDCAYHPAQKKVTQP